MKNVILEPTILLIQRVLILLLATFMFALGWKMSAMKPVLEHKDCVRVLINMKENKLIEVLNESHIPIVYEVEQSMAGQYQNWVITINETNHNRMPDTAVTNHLPSDFDPYDQIHKASVIASNEHNRMIQAERDRWSNYFSWMDYTNAPNKTNE